MYNLVWNTWFRDQNLQNSITVDTGDWPDTASNYVLKKRGKRHDYFTSCLPWTQKTGATEILMPLGTRADIKGIGAQSQTYTAGPITVYETGETSSTSFNPYRAVDAAPSFVVEGTATSNGYPDIYADLTNASAATINQFRQAEAVQVLYERDARGGTRYPEIIYSHFGIENAGGDARFQRPEYLGGGSIPININPIAKSPIVTGKRVPPLASLS